MEPRTGAFRRCSIPGRMRRPIQTSFPIAWRSCGLPVVPMRAGDSAGKRSRSVPRHLPCSQTHHKQRRFVESSQTVAVQSAPANSRSKSEPAARTMLKTMCPANLNSYCKDRGRRKFRTGLTRCLLLYWSTLPRRNLSRVLQPLSMRLAHKNRFSQTAFPSWSATHAS